MKQITLIGRIKHVTCTPIESQRDQSLLIKILLTINKRSTNRSKNREMKDKWETKLSKTLKNKNFLLMAFFSSDCHQDLFDVIGKFQFYDSVTKNQKWTLIKLSNTISGNPQHPSHSMQYWKPNWITRLIHESISSTWYLSLLRSTYKLINQFKIS